MKKRIASNLHRILIGMAVCVFVSMITSYFCSKFNPESRIISSLYAIPSVLFPLGMGFIATSSTYMIKNTRIRNEVRKELDFTRKRFIEQFLLISIIYMLVCSTGGKNESLHIYEDIYLKHSHILISTAIYTTVYFVRNFLAIQRLNDQIEDAVEREENNE